jgi:hypothetical protein
MLKHALAPAGLEDDDHLAVSPHQDVTTAAPGSRFSLSRPAALCPDDHEAASQQLVQPSRLLVETLRSIQ